MKNGLLFLTINFCFTVLQLCCANSENFQQKTVHIQLQDSLMLMQNLQDLACNSLIEYEQISVESPEDKLTAVSGDVCSSNIMVELEQFEIAKGNNDLVKRRTYILQNILKRTLENCGKVDAKWRKQCLSDFDIIYSKVLFNLNRTSQQPVKVEEYSMTNANSKGGFIADLQNNKDLADFQKYFISDNNYKNSLNNLKTASKAMLSVQISDWKDDFLKSGNNILENIVTLYVLDRKSNIKKVVCQLIFKHEMGKD